MLFDMLGVQDPLFFCVYALCILIALLFVVYGLVSWNRNDEPQSKEDLDLAREEKEELEKIL